ncbi:PREDICTED: P17/29C-like protein DDB_G0287399 [Acromyrmex echinatior]|uniref:P17/29C-like protein DDB_G0287399 n=1 Tax=Acromyrmex echinatior TaxID=103372 RepID=UPI000580F512|nr:PREDICTED: P17/29C-like protein DDB_G0287399 [Acromyrmex echinatior]
MRIVPALQLTTICAKQRRCDATLDILVRGYLPSPRPFFHRTRGDPCIKAFFLLAISETTISFNHSSITKLQDSYNSNPILASMLFMVFLVAFACGVCCNENLPTQLLLQLKDKRGINDNLVTFPSGSSSSYSSPVSGLSSGYELGGSSGGFSLGHGGLLNSGGSVGHGIGYSLAPSSGLGLGSGYQSPGLSHSHLSHQSVSLGGHSAQGTYSVPNIAHLGSGGNSNALFAPAKTGPVTFGAHGGSASAASTSSSNSHSAPIYATSGHGLSAYSNGGSNGFQLVLGSNQQHGLSLGSSGASSSYSLPTHSASSSSSHPVTGGLIIASGSHGSSSSYNLPSTSSHSISTLGSSSGTQGASATCAASSYPATSGSSSSTHSGFSSISSGGSNYQLPIASGSHSNSGSSNTITYTNYLPSHSSGSSTSYSSPSVSYSNPSISHVGSPSSGYSGAGTSYTLSANYAAASSSSPVVTYTGSHGYTPTIYSSSSSHGKSADSQGTHTGVSPRYVGYVSEKVVNADLGGAKYDTISYSVPNGKY